MSDMRLRGEGAHMPEDAELILTIQGWSLYSSDYYRNSERLLFVMNPKGIYRSTGLYGLHRGLFGDKSWSALVDWVENEMPEDVIAVLQGWTAINGNNPKYSDSRWR